MPSRMIVLVVADPAGMVHRVRAVSRPPSYAALVRRDTRWYLIATGGFETCRGYALMEHAPARIVLPLRRERRNREE